MSTDGQSGGNAVWPEGFDCIILPELDSTNAEAARRASGLGRPTWIMAHRQTAGRGRRGRDWQTPPGSFAATLVMRPGGVPGWAALRSFLASVALFEAMALFVNRDRLALKWPNDVLLDGGKAGGILLESAGAGGQVEWLAIGVGANLSVPPVDVRDAAFPPTTLGLNDLDPETFLAALADAYATEESLLERMGFEPIREKWLARAARLGEVITARTARDEIVGRFEGIDDQGQLILTTPEGERRVPAADVFF